MVGVQDRAEDARRVEARAAVPVDRPVGADERDRVQVADQPVLGDGQVLLGLQLGSRERYEDWLDSGRDLLARGLRSPALVVADRAPGLWKAVRGQILDEATSVADARAGLLALTADYRRAYPAAIAVIERDLDALVCHLRFPTAHRKRIRSTKLLERTSAEVRRRTKVIGRVPGETSALSLVSAVLELTSRSWRGITMTPRAVAEIERLRSTPAADEMTEHSTEEVIDSANPSIAEDGRRLAEQVAELLDRHRLDVVLRQVRLDELGEREPPRDPPLPSKPLELALERVPRVLLGGESAPLHALRVAAARAVPVRPQPPAAASTTG